MIVTVIGSSSIWSLTLPDRIKGQYWLCSAEKNTSGVKPVGIEAVDGEWIIKSNKDVQLYDNNKNAQKSMKLTPMCIIQMKSSRGETLYVYTETNTLDRQSFRKYLVSDGTELHIGRGSDNDICYMNNMVSSKQAVLSLKEGRWTIRDSASKNGTFVNESRVTEATLMPGDVIYIVGLKVIVGKQLLAINNPDNLVSVYNRKLTAFVKQSEEHTDDEYELPQVQYYYRSPRFKRDIETLSFKIDSPPQSPLSEEMPWLLIMGSSFAMGAMSLVTLVSAFATFNIVSMAMGASMLTGTVLLPTISKRYEKKRKQKKEALRQKKYREYLDSVSVRINEECQRQAEILSENYVTEKECEDRIVATGRNLWERGPGQNDFLKLRVGHGNGLLDAELSYSEHKFSVDDDNLQEEMYNLCEKPKVLENIPITYSLFDNHISGVIGEKTKLYGFAKGLIFQLSALYSYDEVKLVFIYNERDEDSFGFVRWLPHVWSGDEKFRFVATTPNEVKEVSAYLEKEVEERLQINETDMEEVSPYYVILSLSKELSVRAEMIKQVLSKKENIHISIVSFFEELKDLPKESSMVVDLEGEKGCLYNKNDISGKHTEFVPDIELTYKPLDMSVRLANIPLDTLAGGYKLPKMITFLQLFGVGKVEHLNSLTRWKENDPTKSLEAAVGVDTLGETFKLDLHEKFHGPHGLVAGMTGSGKSEFIITYILSLAVNYHPNEVAFILIDYKGGGMAKSFEKLPHTAGIITNLDGAAIKRSLVSIESELKRRQAIFARASKQIGESNIDIYKYQKLYREGTVCEPLQHLFIISDEFAELKAQQPEFMTQLVSAARIGRSLGVHLILATQKPSGVVDDQIWSNSKFRVCLKVQDRADSMDMLKRADAAELTDTGRFYLQVGYNELFEMGQSSWSGAPYYPSDKVISEKDNSVTIIDKNGHTVKQVKLDTRRGAFANTKKQLDVITQYLQTIANEEHIKVRPLWLDPIPAVILLDKIREKYSVKPSEKYILNPVIGEYDDPARQAQGVLRLPITEEGNAVVYGTAGSGKTSFLNAALYSLIQEHTPEEVNIYILDFSSETLCAFAGAPQVGDVVLSHEAEKVSNLFKMLNTEVQKRKKLFADYGGDYSSYVQSCSEPVASIVVAINNFAAFTEIYEEKEEAVAFLSREGTKYGIYFILTSLGTGGVRFRLLQNFKQLFVLQLNDEADYSTIVGKTDGLYPSKYKGRGLVKKDCLYEFQIASLVEKDSPYAFIRQSCEKINNEHSGKAAARIPILPEIVDAEFLSGYIQDKNKLSLPVGVEKNTLRVNYYPFGEHYVNMILSSANEYQKYLNALCSLVAEKTSLDVLLLDVPKAVDTEGLKLTAASGAEECEAQVSSLFELVLSRNNEYKTSTDKSRTAEHFTTLVVFVNSLLSLRTVLSDQANEKLTLILEKGEREYNVCLIIGESSKAASGYSFEKWYKSQVTQLDGIWVGNGITEQYQLKANKTTSDMHDETGKDFGYSLQNGRCVKIKLLKKGAKEQDDDE